MITTMFISTLILTMNTTNQWYQQYKVSGNLSVKKSPDWVKTTEENVNAYERIVLQFKKMITQT